MSLIEEIIPLNPLTILRDVYKRIKLIEGVSYNISDIESILNNLLEELGILEIVDEEAIMLPYRKKGIIIEAKLSEYSPDRKPYIVCNEMLIWNNKDGEYVVMGSLLTHRNTIRRLTVNEKILCRNRGYIIDESLFPKDEVIQSMKKSNKSIGKAPAKRGILHSL